MTKEEKIKEAYGIYSDVALDLCDENGWIKSFDYHSYFPQNNEEMYINNYNHKRPKSLSGIENNNGWIRFEDKLPEIGDRIISRRDLIEKVIEDIETVTRDFLVWYDMNNITHWKYYESKPPIY